MAICQKSCFISYSHDGIDRDTLDYFVKVLEDAIKPNGKIFIDKNVRYGEDFNQFMKLVESVDLIILVLTPTYKQKVIDRKGGAYTEFKYLYDRYNSFQEITKDEENDDITIIKKIELIPILFSGSREQSTPDEISDLRQLDLTGLRVSRKSTGEFSLSKQLENRYISVIHEVAKQIITTATLVSEEYKNLADTFYSELFIDLKASWNRPDNRGRDFLSSQFVKTLTYELVSRQQAVFVVGRKGSGKSTLTQALPLLHEERYNFSIEINADHYNLESLYTLYSNPQFRSDTCTAVSRVLTFDFTWEAALMLSLMHLLTSTDLTTQNQFIDREPYQAIFNFVDQFKEICDREDKNCEWRQSDFFNYSFGRAMDFVRICIDDARNDPQFFLVDIQRDFTRENFLIFVFGNDLLILFREFIRNFKKKFLVTLDGFDTAFDSFRLESIRTNDEMHLRSRAHFETDWLRSLLALTIRAKSNSGNYLYSILEFCMAAPLDRFLEVVKVDRDSYRYWNRWSTIQWSGIELAILLRKRLEGISSYQLSRDLSPQLRLERILDCKQFKHIPSTISFEFHGKSYSMPLFMYVLRHTFWRPRGLLVYYARILAFSEQMKRWGNEVDSESLRRCVKSATIPILESEFINELRSTVVNIESIIRSFRNKKNLLSFQEVRKIVNSENYKFATGDLTENDVTAKIKFLYDVGFLGLNLLDNQQERLGVWHKNAFVFNEGNTIFGDNYLEEEDLEHYEFIIHPIFCEFLHLDTKDTDLPLIFTWEYLNKAEAALRSRFGT
jgi:energy-coupling factor transporter ATP-binding protein EcfA2